MSREGKELGRGVDAGSRHQQRCVAERRAGEESRCFGGLVSLSLFSLPTSPLGLSWLPPSARFVVHQGPLSSLLSCLFTVPTRRHLPLLQRPTKTETDACLQCSAVQCPVKTRISVLYNACLNTKTSNKETHRLCMPTGES